LLHLHELEKKKSKHVLAFLIQRFKFSNRTIQVLVNRLNFDDKQRQQQQKNENHLENIKIFDVT